MASMFSTGSGVTLSLPGAECSLKRCVHLENCEISVLPCQGILVFVVAEETLVSWLFLNSSSRCTDI